MSDSQTPPVAELVRGWTLLKNEANPDPHWWISKLSEYGDRMATALAEQAREAVTKFESWEKAENGYHDQISTLAAEVERLTGELDAYKEQASRLIKQCADTEAGRDTARTALRDCYAAIFSPLNKQSIVDTIWHGAAETLADHILNVLEPHPELPFAPPTPGDVT